MWGSVKTSLRLTLGAVLALSEKGLFYLQDGHKKMAVNRFISGNFAPQMNDDVVATHLPIQGYLPKELVGGLYARIGPNPAHISGNYHWFDGDGYVHAVRFGSGHANYSGSFVQTSRLKQEVAADRALFSKFGDCTGPAAIGHVLIEQLRNLLGILDLSRGWGTANTALVYHAGRLLALHEGDQPYALHVNEEDGRVQTIGRVHVGGRTQSSWFTAHPKLVPGPDGPRMYAFGYSLLWRPYATFYRISEQGQQTAMVPLDLAYPTMLHDFGVTESYAVFVQTSMRFDVLHCLKAGRSIFAYDEKSPLRFLVLPLNATSSSEGRWFTLPPGVMFHVAASWEEANGSIIRLYAMRFSRHFELNVDWMQFSMDKATDKELDDMGVHLWEFVLDLSTGEATQRRLMQSVPQTCEFPQIHPGRVGAKARYVYCTLFHANGRLQSFVKVDLDTEDEAAGVKSIELEAGTGGGEVTFVPRQDEEGEDDGYLVLFVHNDYTQQSELRVYDARTMDPTPLASVPLPQRVPYGFHGTFIPQHQLARQQSHVLQVQQQRAGTGGGSSTTGGKDLVFGGQPPPHDTGYYDALVRWWWGGHDEDHAAHE